MRARAGPEAQHQRRQRKVASPGTAGPVAIRPRPTMLTPAGVLDLQRTIGNQAVTRMFEAARPPLRLTPAPPLRVQRLPTGAVIEAHVGEAKSGRKVGKKTVKEGSTRLKPLLAAFNAYDDFLDSLVSPVSFSTLQSHLDSLAQLTSEYTKSKKSGYKYAYFKNLLVQIDMEAETVVARYKAFQPQQGQPLPKWRQFTRATSPSALVTDKDTTGQVSGGTRTLDQTQLRGEAAFFKENTNEVPNISALDETDWKIKGTPLEGLEGEMIKNRHYQPLWAGMFGPEDLSQGGPSTKAKRGVPKPVVADVDLRSANRDVATARLSQLLDSQVIAHAELAYRKKGKNLELGSLMVKAQGKTQDQLTVATDATVAPGPDVVAFDDPNLQRLLSRLQLIDALCGQTDRNLSNFYILTDTQGNVTKLTGIDHDISFGKNRLGFEKTSGTKFPGISQYVDAELARRIIALDPADLRLALFELLNEDELYALEIRLKELQKFLLGLQDDDKLLEPDQWSKATAAGMFDENSSYYAEVMKARGVTLG